MYVLYVPKREGSAESSGTRGARAPLSNRNMFVVKAKSQWRERGCLGAPCMSDSALPTSPAVPLIEPEAPRERCRSLAEVCLHLPAVSIRRALLQHSPSHYKDH